MDAKIEKLTQSIDKMFAGDWFESIKNKTCSPAKGKMCLNQENDVVSVSMVIGKGITSFDASIEDNLMTIDIPDKHHKIYVRYDADHNYISVAQSSSIQEKTEKEGARQEMASFSSVQHGQTLAQAIKFSDAKVEYKDDTLSVIIPKITPSTKPAAQKITVDIK